MSSEFKTKANISLFKTLTPFCLMVLMILALNFWSYRVLQSSHLSVLHTKEVKIALFRILSDLHVAEQNQFSYLLTGQKRYLKFYNQAKESVSKSLKSLRQLKHEDKNFSHKKQVNQSHVDEIEALVRKKFSEMKKPMKLRKKQRIKAALRIIKVHQKEKIIGQIRKVSDTINAEEELVLKQKIQLIDKIKIFSLLSVVILIIFVVFVIWQINRSRVMQRHVEQVLLESNKMLEQAVATKTADLHNQAVRLQAVMDTSIDGIIIINEKGVVKSINPAAVEMFGYQSGEVVDRNIKMLIPEDYREAHAQGLKNYLITGEKKVIGIGREAEGLRKDGKIFSIDLSIGEIILEGERFFSGTVRNITKRKKIEEERETLLKKLTQSNQELERFAYVASHDLKAPLHAIDNLSMWIEEDLKDVLQGESKENMTILRKRVIRLKNLLNDLLEYSRVGRKTNQLYKEEINGKELLDDIITLIDPPKHFTFHIHENFASIRINRMPLQQIFLNLINNAIKHHDKKKGNISISVEQTNTHYKFSVTDDGPGIPEKYQRKVFEMFQTLKPRDEVEGSGMGLAIVDKIVKTYGSNSLKLESKTGEGCAFSFSWPKIS